MNSFEQTLADNGFSLVSYETGSYWERTKLYEVDSDWDDERVDLQTPEDFSWFRVCADGNVWDVSQEEFLKEIKK